MGKHVGAIPSMVGGRGPPALARGHGLPDHRGVGPPLPPLVSALPARPARGLDAGLLPRHRPAEHALDPVPPARDRGGGIGRGGDDRGAAWRRRPGRRWGRSSGTSRSSAASSSSRPARPPPPTACCAAGWTCSGPGAPACASSIPARSATSTSPSSAPTRPSGWSPFRSAVPGSCSLWATTIYNFALGFSCWHVLAVNTILLPKEIRPGWGIRIALVAGGLLLLRRWASSSRCRTSATSSVREAPASSRPTSAATAGSAAPTCARSATARARSRSASPPPTSRASR